MDILDEVAEATPVNLDDLIEERPLAPLAPEASIRNRAAIAALQSDKPLENYQVLHREASEGRSDLYNQLKQERDRKEDVLSQEALMLVLADPATTPEMAQRAIQSINKGVTKDSGRQLAMNAAKQVVEGESQDRADVRIHAAEIFDEIHQYQKDKQAILNGHGMSLNTSTPTFLLDLVESVIPLANNKLSADVLSDAATAVKLSIGKGSAFVLPGNAKKAIREAIENAPPKQQVEITRKIRSIVEKNEGIVFRDDNDFAEYMLVNDLFGEGGYGTFDQYLDNASGLLDLIGLGVIRTAGKVFKMFKRTPEAMESNVARRSVTDNTSPVSPGNLTKDTNPEQAKQLLNAVEESEGDEVSKALFGAKRDETIASQTVPQPPSVDGTVESKIINPNKSVLNIINDFGGYWLSGAEKANAFDNISAALKNAKGLTLHDNLSYGVQRGIAYEGKSVYGLAEGGFSNAEDAINQAKYSLSEFGVVDKDIQILKKIDGEYAPVDLNDVKGVDGDYLVSIDIKKDIGVNDIGSFDHFKVKRNFFDSIPALRSNKQGTFANSLLDNASMLSKRITGGAVVQTDKGVLIDKVFLQEFDDFAKPFRSLPDARQGKVYDYLKLANRDGLDEDALTLTGRGFTSDEIDIVQKWRKAWDTQWFFENRDLVKTLSAQNYGMLDHANAKLVLRKAQKDKNITSVYDPDLDKVVKISAQEMDDLYTNGGYFGRLRRPQDFGGELVENVIVRNNTSNYIRAFNQGDEVLSYRKGYYQVHYDAPHFVVHKVKDKSGNVLFERAVDVAGDTKAANHIRDRLASQTGDEFYVRGDIKKFTPDTDYYWDLQSSAGRLAQKRRGAPLQDPTIPIGMSDNFMVDPVEGAIRSARSLANRIAMRDYLEQTKARLLQQYGDSFPQSQFGQPLWTENANSLVQRGRMTTSEMADARTSVEYLNYLQRGYENSFDEGFKGLMNALANRMANISGRGERLFLSASNINPTDLAKNTVFQAYIATNPARQFIVQAHQSIRLLGWNTSYMVNGGWSRDVLTYWTKHKLGVGTLSKQEKELVDFIEGSGMLDAVDRHNLVRGAITDMAESGNKVKRVAGKALAIPRKLGFDLGEQFNLATHLMAVRDKAVKAGKNVNDPAVRDELYSQTRAMAYDMNFAGDMPYNQNVMAMLLQFAQVPHKAITSVTTNRRIPVRDRIRLAATDIALFGVPGSVVLSDYITEDMLPENPEMREAVLFGVESALANRLASYIAGKDVNIDVSSLAPFNIDGWSQMADAFLSGGFWEMLAHAPAANVLFKSDSKVQDAIGRMIRYGGYYDPERPEDLASVASGILEISSGWSNYLKAKTIWETGNIMTKNGQVIKENVTGMEAFAKSLGFGTQEEAYTYFMRNKLSETSKAYADEVKEWTKTYVRYLTRQEKLTSDDPEYYIKTLGAARRVWGDSIRAQEIINAELEKLSVDVKDGLIRDMIKHSGLPMDNQRYVEMRNSGILNDDEFNKAMQLIDDINKTKLEDE